MSRYRSFLSLALATTVTSLLFVVLCCHAFLIRPYDTLLLPTTSSRRVQIAFARGGYLGQDGHDDDEKARRSFSLRPNHFPLDTKNLRNPIKSMYQSIPLDSTKVSMMTDPEKTLEFHEKIMILHEQPSRNVSIHVLDRRPHEQRVTTPRKARRLNHSFQHLYRHDDPKFDDCGIALGSRVMTNPYEYLMEYGGYSSDMILQMNETFPPLFNLHVIRHIRPKMRFLKYTILAECPEKQRRSSLLVTAIPPQYFGARLEKIVAPRHAFLIHVGLPHGQKLLEKQGALFRDFLIACRHVKSFCTLCNEWRKTYGHLTDPLYTRIFPNSTLVENSIVRPCQDLNRTNPWIPPSLIEPYHIESFDSYFQRGIMAAARDDMDPHTHPQNGRNPRIPISTAQIIHLLVRHGANPLERDVRDISLFHWAAGSGNLDGLKELIRLALPGGVEEAITLRAERDGATLLHWAATGAKPKAFGCGGHLHVCQYILESCNVVAQSNRSKGRMDEKDIVNACSKDGNSVLMWAAWSGSLEIVKLLIRHRADPTIRNRNGCTVAHWAASGGNLDLCKYLHEILSIDFSIANHAGNTPLSHALAYGRSDIVSWLLEDVRVKESSDRAQSLALEMMQWETVSDKKKITAQLFSDWWNYDDEQGSDTTWDQSESDFAQ